MSNIANRLFESYLPICLLKRGKEGIELGEWGGMEYLGVNEGGEIDQIYFMKKMLLIIKNVIKLVKN